MPVRITPTGADRGKAYQRDEQADIYLDEEPNVTHWVRRRWWAVALLTLLAAGVVVALIVGPVCGVRGCPPKNKSNDNQGSLDDIPRLIVQFNLPNIDAMDVIPALLHAYTSRLWLNSSSLQILNFIDESVLQKAMEYLQQNTELALLTRDFKMYYSPNGIDVAQLVQQASNLNGDAASIAEQAAQLLSRRKGRRLHQTDPVPVNDPFIKNNTQWHHATIKSQVAWSTTPGSPSVVIAIIDSGFDLSHPDLKNRMWVNTQEIPGNGIDDDGNGYVDDYHGYDFVGQCQPGTANTMTTTCTCIGGPNPDWNGTTHGTHVAGLVAAQANNSVGGAGTAPNVRLMLLKVSDCTPDHVISASAVFEALDYAHSMGAHIVSMSLGSDFAYGAQPRSGPTDDRYQQWQDAYVAAIQPLTDKDVLVVAAAGNEALDLDALYNLGYTYTPCGVPLANVLCVGATDQNDNQDFYSNFGLTKVHVSSPGNTILSTVPVGKYAALTGTSMSTPIVSGVAGLVASVLGSTDKDYYRATQIKALLMNSGDYMSSLASSSSTGRRINAFNAVTLALRTFAKSGAVPSLSPRSSVTTLPGVIRVQGFSEEYYANYNSLVLDSSGQDPIDRSVRAGSPSFAGFKFLSGVMVNMTATLRVNVTGLHTFTMTFPTTFTAGVIEVNDVGLSVVNGTATFMASAAGWYKVSFVFLPVSSGSVVITLAPPGVSAPGALYPESYVTWTPQSYVAPKMTNNYTNPQYPLALGFNSGWWVFFNVTDPVVYNGTTLNAVYQGINDTSIWQYQTDVYDLQMSTNTFKSTLLPGTSFNSILGVATTTWNTAGLPSEIKMTVVCKGCVVKMNGMLVVDNWAAYKTSIPVGKTSACISINPGSKYTMSVEFAMSGSAALLLNWAACSGGSTNAMNSPVRASLSTAVIDMGQFRAQQYIGWIPGVQCDAWRTNANATAVPASTPLYKFRLPACNSPEYANSTSCTTLWNFTLDGTIRGGLNASSPAAQLFAVRCWTYTNVTLPGRSLVASPTTVWRDVWLAGFRRYYASPTTVITRLLTPANIDYGGTEMHQLLVDWVGVTATQTLNLLSNGVPIKITLDRFRLPLWVTADNLNNGDPVDPLLNQKVLGAPGVYADAYLRNSVDILNVVASDMGQVGRAYRNVSSSTQALNGPLQFPDPQQLTQYTFYSFTEGYYWTLTSNLIWSQLVFNESAASSTQILAGDVVIRNARPFNSASGPATSQTVEVYLPPGYLRMQIIQKVRSTSGTVTYDYKATADGYSDLTLDLGGWFRAVWQM